MQQFPAGTVVKKTAKVYNIITKKRGALTVSANDYRFDGSRRVCLQDMPTTAGDRKKDKAELVEKTAKNIARAAELQEKLYAEDPAVIDGCQTQGFREKVETAIFNSKGLDLHYANTAAGLVVVSVVSDG